ncbi:uncharacterized protein NECHADRAFT_86671 [Fusarium vanettenii 77-13-4]|uniref:Zn(2)-C6 fungal-type domain-containing protein n=1 Tax=Fusarium vanettenii (strain ATCC MYA-4622 / CBS 123669 / FGSC 9596 / NRRL 45880 / 77-13-4) TaxID=660122 RepID=C7ZFT7_FUSV7|nr:uncharacterized protein NECHADRAFT_86671 [Fusarium vanettenii 77-13-4]EEU37094.1 hypothetical protein NECHADRAFT_86671 [Fusarium vanettenii 77-13-4]
MPTAARGKRKSTCWTCRLRHKWCDGVLPVCGACAALDISCYYSHVRPDWMDDGQGQQQMVQKIKTQVKQGAKRRRGIAMMQNIAQTLAIHNNPNELSPRSSSPQSRSSGEAGPPLADAAMQSHSLEQAPRSQVNCLSTQPISLPGPSNSQATTAGRASPPTLMTTELEMGYLMGYMEYVFPIMFPFYKPAILEGGRTWPLMLAMKNLGFSKSVTSLSSYFFSVIPVIPGPVHNACFAKTWQELSHQTNVALASVQRDLLGLRSQGVSTNLRDGIHLLANIVQLLLLERELFMSSEWQVHLKAAVDLLGQILLYHGINMRGEGPNIAAVVEKLADPVPFPASVSTPLTTEQGAFRFFSAILVVDDIVASTCLEQPSELRQYLSKQVPSDQDQRYTLSLQAVTGCQDWVFELIGDIAAFDAWKKTKKKNGELVMDKFHHHARKIDQRWQKHVDHLDQHDSRHQHETNTASGLYGPLESVLRDSNRCQVHDLYSSDIHVRVTKIWAYAARTYLLVTLLGWQPTHQDILSSIKRTYYYIILKVFLF